MNRIRCIHPIRRITGLLAGLAGALLAFTAAAPAALAMRVPPPGTQGSGGSAYTPPPVVHTVIAGGMPGWQITLIAIAAAAATAAVAVALDRTRAARRHVTAPGT